MAGKGDEVDTGIQIAQSPEHYRRAWRTGSRSEGREVMQLGARLAMDAGKAHLNNALHCGECPSVKQGSLPDTTSLADLLRSIQSRQGKEGASFPEVDFERYPTSQPRRMAAAEKEDTKEQD